MEATEAARNTRITASTAGPQNGSSTHSQDQAITPVSFRVTKIRPSTEQIPIFIITSVLFRTTNPTTGSIHEHGDDLWASICNHHTP